MVVWELLSVCSFRMILTKHSQSLSELILHIRKMCTIAPCRGNKCQLAVILDLALSWWKMTPYICIFQLNVLLHHNAHWKKYSLIDTFTVYYFTSILNKIEIMFSNTFKIREVKFRVVLWKHQSQNNRWWNSSSDLPSTTSISSTTPQVAFIGSTHSLPKIKNICSTNFTSISYLIIFSIDLFLLLDLINAQNFVQKFKLPLSLPISKATSLGI